MGIPHVSLKAQKFPVVVGLLVTTNIVWSAIFFAPDIKLPSVSRPTVKGTNQPDNTSNTGVQGTQTEVKDGENSTSEPTSTPGGSDASATKPGGSASSPSQTAKPYPSNPSPGLSIPSPAPTPQSPASTEYVVEVKLETTGVSVNVVQANVSYPTSQLQFKSVSSSGSCFPNKAQESVSGGVVYIARYTDTGGSTTCGGKVVARITFEKLTSGTSSVQVAGGSLVSRASDSANILGSVPGVAIYF